MRSTSLVGLGLVALFGGYWALFGQSTQTAAIEAAGVSFSCTVASVSDGDTFNCAETDVDGRQIHVRLSGIAAREADGSCSPGHPCPASTAFAASAYLASLTAGEVLTCRDVGRTYGRIAAFCRRSDGLDLSCAMVASGTASRWDRYWHGHRC